MAEKALKARARDSATSQPKRAPTRDELQAWIAEAAYYRAERRGFQPGYETDDWLAAEAEISAQLGTAHNVI